MPDKDLVIVFSTTHQTLKAESVLEKGAVHFRTVMKPRKISSDCGLAIRIAMADMHQVQVLFAQAPLEPMGYFTESAKGWVQLQDGEGP